MTLERVVDAPVYGQLFTLVEGEEDGQQAERSEEAVFAWGVQITTPSERFAIIFDCRNTSSTLGIHESADAACRRHSHMRPVAVRWSGSRTAMSADGVPDPDSTDIDANEGVNEVDHVTTVRADGR